MTPNATVTNLLDEYSTVAASVLKVAYGHEVIEHDPLVKLAEEWLDQFARLNIPGEFLVEALPISEFWTKIALLASEPRLASKISSRMVSRRRFQAHSTEMARVYDSAERRLVSKRQRSDSMQNFGLRDDGDIIPFYLFILGKGTSLLFIRRGVDS